MDGDQSRNESQDENREKLTDLKNRIESLEHLIRSVFSGKGGAFFGRKPKE